MLRVGTSFCLHCNNRP